MKLSKKVMAITFGCTTLFAILFLFILAQYAHSVQEVSEYSQTMDEPREAIEHLISTIYSDFLLVEEYLLITDYTKLKNYDILLHESEQACEEITDSVDAQIAFGAIKDPNIVENYQAAILVYSSWQRSRDALLRMHREAMATGAQNSSALQKERQRFLTLMEETTSYFTQSLNALHTQQVRYHQDLAHSTRRVQYQFIVLLLLFIGASTAGIFFFVRRLVVPLDGIIKASRQFTSGTYDTRVKEGSSIPVIVSLQEQLNRVFSLIDSTFNDTKKKKEATKHLLPSQYADVLDCVRHFSAQGKMPTIKDLKKELGLTHPTTVSRLRYLEKQGILSITKKGRNKYVSEM